MRDRLINLLYEAEGQVNNDIPSVEQIADYLLANGVNVKREGEWEMFNLITSTYYGKQYYFLNKDGSVYSRASHTNMSRDEAVDEFLSIFRE
jgi:hypothetical protein